MPRSNSDASAYYAAPQNGRFDRIWTDIEQRKGARITVTANSGEKHLEKLVEMLWTGVRGGKTLWLWRIHIDDESWHIASTASDDCDDTQASQVTSTTLRIDRSMHDE